MLGFFKENTLEIIIAVVVTAVVAFAWTVADRITTAVNEAEISQSEYTDLVTDLKKFPSIKPLVDNAMVDSRITRSELSVIYNEVYRLNKEATLNNVKEELRK